MRAPTLPIGCPWRQPLGERNSAIQKKCARNLTGCSSLRRINSERWSSDDVDARAAQTFAGSLAFRGLAYETYAALESDAPTVRRSFAPFHRPRWIGVQEKRQAAQQAMQFAAVTGSARPLTASSYYADLNELALDRVPFLHRIAAHLPRTNGASASRHAFALSQPTAHVAATSATSASASQRLQVPDRVRELCRTLCAYASLASRARDKKLDQNELAVAPDAEEREDALLDAEAGSNDDNTDDDDDNGNDGARASSKRPSSADSDLRVLRSWAFGARQMAGSSAAADALGGDPNELTDEQVQQQLALLELDPIED